MIPANRLKRGCWCVLGYLAAVAASSQLTLALFLMVQALKRHPDRLTDYPAMMLFAALLTFMYSAVPALAFIVAAEVKGYATARYYVPAGLVTAMIALGLFAQGRVTGVVVELLGPCAIGGTVGGYVYWRWFGRRPQVAMLGVVQVDQ